jgi:hypothetical protein
MATYLLPDSIARQDGASREIPLESVGCKPLQLTLGITRIVEQESLELSLWGSEDRDRWQFLAAFPQKFYCGTYSMLLDLTRYPGLRYLRAQWKMSRWTRHADSEPLFGFYLLADDAKFQAAGAA